MKRGETSRIERYLRDFRERFEPFLTGWLEREVVRLTEVDRIGRVMAEAISEFTLRGGKRIRAALVNIGYSLAGGLDASRIFLACVAYELLHAYFLIQDDIADKDYTRRGRPTVHRRFQEIYSEILSPLSEEEREHFANSIAMFDGNICRSMAFKALSELDFSTELVLKAVRHFGALDESTNVGQVVDILAPLKAGFMEKGVMKIAQLKTARYTIEGPLQLGMILAGAGDEQLRQISDYAIPVGEAFQIRDDILGVFGSEEEMGKPVTSDLEEAKKTLLTVFVQRRGGRFWKKLSPVLGKKGLTLMELKEARAIFRSSGALREAEVFACKLVEEGKSALGRLSLPEEFKALLSELADYLVARRT
ncbi:MAG: geranylgeranyl pyrophosphate synthase [Parcubacteria group bacterium Gr01-1014_30]|nr:MAG: geranylgeranyl pyrophosphate synthase [Parcubacteria group bacterium Gr01-1014_30]